LNWELRWELPVVTLHHPIKMPFWIQWKDLLQSLYCQNNCEFLGFAKYQDFTSANFDETLSPLLNGLKKIDLAFIDGNHRHEPTARYFRQLLPLCYNDTILIFDDIHWSEDNGTGMGRN
jgi:hypothetical protein